MRTLFILSLVISTSQCFGQTAASKTLYLWMSGDGTTFNNETYFLDSADVPSIVQDSSGLIVATYQSFKGGMSSPDWDRIGVRFSSDNGASWTPHQTISISGLPGTSQRAFDPTITVIENNQYRLYFSYCPNTMMLDSTCDTYSATSSDAINYTLDPGIRMSVDNKEVIDPGTCHFNNLWYYINPIGAPQDGARSASSSDGLNFTTNDTIGESGPGTNWTGNLMNNGSTMRFYGGSDNANNYTIWWNETSDGINWTGYNWTNVEGSGAKDPGIWKLNNGQYMMIVSKDSVSAIAGVEDMSSGRIMIFPNPAEDEINIFLENGNARSIHVFNSVGQLILIADPNSYKIDLSEQPSGVYVLQVVTESGQVITEKIFKQ